MLVIRMQRTGRKGHAQFRVVVQDSRRTPTSGNVVANLGSYDPHTKTVTLDKEKAALYMNNGAQPSPRVARIFQSEGVALPKWVKQSEQKTKSIRNTEKLRRNRPAEEKVEEAPAAEAEAPAAEEPAVEAAAPEAEAAPAEPTPEVAADTESEAPAEEAPADTEEPA